MARVVRRTASAWARRNPSRAVHRRTRKHKVIMESVTQEKKKLRSVICFEAQAPSGYTFIPAGNPHLTSTCKERCRKEGSQVYAVSVRHPGLWDKLSVLNTEPVGQTTPHMHIHNLSQHVHRIGYHFPSTVVAAACSELGLYLTSTGKAVPFHTLGSLENPPPADSETSQITINTEARDAIRDLFPNIPDNDLNQIIKTAFQKGQRKVGTASELPLARRAQLAVVAHIRHIYTDYDRLLKQTSFHEARSAVEQITLSKVIAWRGDDENGQTVLEDVFREVIVISDDEDSETEEETATAADTQDLSVEILSSNARTHEIQTQPISASRVNHSIQDFSREHSEEAPPGFRIVTRVPAQKAIDRRGFSRYQAWNRALSRYRAEANDIQKVQASGAPAEKQSPRYGKRSVATHEMSDPVRHRELPVLSQDPTSAIASRPVYVDNPGQRLIAVPATDSSPGQGYNSHETRPLDKSPRTMGNVCHQSTSCPDMCGNARSERLLIPTNNRSDMPVFVSRPKELHQSSESHFGPRADPPVLHHPRPGANHHDLALPSIESPFITEKRRAEGRLEHLTKRMSLRSVTPGHSQVEASGQGYANVPSSPDDQNCKRRRLAYYAAPPSYSRPDHWNTRPLAIPTSEGPRGTYRRDELIPESRLQDRPYRRDYCLPPAEESVTIGYQRQRNPASLMPPQVSLDPRPPLDTTRTVDPHEPVSIHPQPGLLSGAAGPVAASDRTFKPVPNASHLDTRPVYYGDRSSHLDRIRPMLEETRAPVWRSNTETDRPVLHGTSANGKLYADDFVRHVDVREALPVEYLIQRPRYPPPRVEESHSQPARARIANQYSVKDSPSSQISLEQQHPRSPHRVPVSHGQVSHPHEIGNRDLPNNPSDASRERRPNSGLGMMRRTHDPRSFQMAEQNRPVYVQQVESQPPPYPVSEGRHFVIVD
ncbi:hypothetical protein N7462_004151 [Penicillium macrosclerotiorum]|uniref:uncharacterized protein n=1 Tax=Penicillium macrosclerotiorum TaxID=303699 RepID=UPI002547E47A|nr:uncharacterized protein N7462_004151 [Penicillium macrosclerotiorum]KAJ5689759.1 hypothetical protein N7462_004151 [Penicillium macrosclerotiorum]